MIIYLLSGPGTISTALMYSFNQRRDTLIMDEPFYGIYLKQNGKKQAYFDEVMLRMECDDANKIHDEIGAKEKVRGNVFVKNRTNTVKHMNENRLLNYRHILLIQDPAESIVSQINTNPSMTSEDLCLEYQVKIYDWLKTKTKEAPIVIDSNELRTDPAAVLMKTCKKLNLPYTDRMLSWPAGPKSIDGFWAQTSDIEVHLSTGFRSPLSTKITRDDIPKNLLSLYDATLPYYEKLLSNSM